MKNVGLLPSGEVDGEKNEIIVYQPEGGEFHIEVRVDQDTVWLTQAQMAELFGTVPQNITVHIKKVYDEGELEKNSTCKEYLQVASEGSRKVKRTLKRTMREVHDRFIVVDETVYHIGASIKDLDNKLTAFSVLSLLTKQQLLDMIK